MASQKLIEQVQMLLLNEGIHSRVSEKQARATNGTGDFRTYYRLSITGYKNICLLRSEIGLHDAKKQSLLYSVVESGNKTSRDSLPNCETIISNIVPMLDGSRENGQLRKRSKRVATGVRPLNYTLAKDIVEYLDNNLISSENGEYLRKLVDQDYQYDVVDSVCFGEPTQCVDITVPGTHSFTANGFVSHNSSALAQFGKEACLSGRNVLFVTLEVSAQIYADRMDANISNTDMFDLVDSARTVKKRVEEVGATSGMMKIHEFPTGTMTPAALSRLISRYKSQGTVFDMVVLDYADLMRPNEMSKEPIQNSKSIYIDLRAIAQTENVALLTATQLNREGAKALVAGGEHVAEDYNRIRIADLVISINKTDEEKASGIARLAFAAGRNQADGFVVVIKQQMDKMQFMTDLVEIR